MYQWVERGSLWAGDAFGQQWNAARSYTVNGLNQYSKAGASTLTYDTRGNTSGITSGPNAGSYTYSSENYLLTGSGVTLGYDPLGRLYQTVGSTTTRLGYDGLALISEYNSSNILQRRYVHGPGTDEPIVWYEGSDRRWLHADERGSIVAISNGSGSMTAINSYDEYGTPATTNAGRFGYTGQTWISDLNLWHYKARFYSPRLGRFMQTDPIGYGDGMNLYAYVGNDPVNLTDPLGLCKGAPTYEDCDIEVTGWKKRLGGGITGSINSAVPAARESVGDRGGSGGKVPPQKAEPKREPFDPAKDYCGSQGFNVSDGNWAEACKAHDDCYATPGAIKEVCDLKLARDMAAACSGKIFVPALCVIPGSIYGLGLMLFGIPNRVFQPSRDAYNGAQRGN